MPTTCINTAGVQYVRKHLANFPRPDREATRAIRGWAATHNLTLDPDQVDVVTLHYHPDGAYGYQAVVISRMSLTQAVLSNWQGESSNDLFGALFSAPWAGTFPDGPVKIVERLPTPELIQYGASFQVFNGLFRRTEPARHDHSTHLQIPAEDFQRFIEQLDFHSRYKSLLDSYWRDHLEGHRMSAKLGFVAACNKQVGEGSLSDAARKLAWQAAGLMPRSSRLRLSTLSIYGYAATDLLYINDADSDLTLLYVPGNSSPLLEFISEVQLKDWVGRQCQDPLKRQALKQHFNLADAPDGLDFSGLDTALAGLGEYPAVHRLSSNRPGFTTDGRWSPRDYVNYRPKKYNPRLTGDVFQALAERQQQRGYADADFIITSNSEVTKAKWRGYLTSALNLLTPLAFVVPGLAPLLAVGGIAQLGLGLDQAINGKTLQDKADGVGNIAYGLFNATPLVVDGLAKGSALFRVKSDGFVLPSRVNDQLGYPLSPVDPPRLPEVEVASYFHRPERIAPLDNGNAAVTSSVRRYPRYTGQPDHLAGYFAPHPDYVEELDLAYDMEFDLFLKTDSLNNVDPTYYQAQTGTDALVPTDPYARAVTDQMRSSTLRALGIDLPLPVELPVPTRGVRPIPKTITALWVGDKAISAELVENLGKNANKLKNSQYQYRLFLSRSNPSVYEQNLRQLRVKAPGLTVLPLEEQAFFRAFEQSKYFDQYQAALDGNGGVATNYASASDVLRYPMLHHEGGLYIDVDDELLAPGSNRSGCIGWLTPCGAQGVNDVELAASEDGLLLHPAMSNEKLSMDQQYNTSMIGSHPGNPTLIAISEEMHGRYQAEPDFYQSRPDKDGDPAGFYNYASRLNRLTGPGMLTAVVDRLLPDLYRLRQLRNLYAIPRTKSWLYVDLQAWSAVERELLPLGRFAKVGGQHSWAHT